MINYIFFDRGEVLTTIGTKNIIIKRIMDEFNLDRQIVLDTFDSHTQNLDRGVITEAEFWSNFLEDLGLDPKTPHNIDLCEIYRINTKINSSTFEIAEELRNKGYRMGIITNTILSIHEYNQIIGLYNGFNPVVASCDVKYMKPEIQIYQLALEKVKQDPKHCLFIDDKEKFLEPASSLGMKTIHYTSSSRLEKELRALKVL